MHKFIIVILSLLLLIPVYATANRSVFSVPVDVVPQSDSTTLSIPDSTKLNKTTDSLSVVKDTVSVSGKIKDKKGRVYNQNLPPEFPEGYAQELDAYYARQKTYQKILRRLENTRNYVSFSSNLLYDAILIPNLAVEFSLTEKWSLCASWMYAWWAKKNSGIFWRVYGGDVTIRRWFGKKSKERRLTGHHIGLYGQLLTYDVDLGGQAQMSEGWNYAIGLEYGHSFAISNSFNIDVFAGIGYLMGSYKDYSNKDDHYVWQQTVDRKTIFPTKLGVSLVWILPIKKKSILYED